VIGISSESRSPSPRNGDRHAPEYAVDPNVEFNAGEFCRKMDALLALLDSAADALAAEWDLRSGAVPELEPDDGGFWRTIH